MPVIAPPAASCSAAAVNDTSPALRIARVIASLTASLLLSLIEVSPFALCKDHPCALTFIAPVQELKSPVWATWELAPILHTAPRQTVRTPLSDIVRFICVLRSESPRHSQVVVLAALGLSLATPAIAYTSLRMFDAILVQHSELATVEWMALEIVLAAAVTILTYLQADAIRLFRDEVALKMTAAVARKMTAIPVAVLEGPSLREQLLEARETAEHRASQLFVDLVAMMQGLLSLVICLLLVMRFTWLAVVFVAAAGPGLALELWSARLMHRASTSLAHDRRRFDRIEDDVLSTTNAIETRFLGAAPRLLLPRLRSIVERMGQAQVRVWRRLGIAVAAVQLVQPLAFYGVNLYLGIEAAQGSITYGALTLCLITMVNTRQFTESAVFAARSAGEGVLHLRTYFAFIQYPVAVRALPAPREQPRGLRLENVGYRYPGCDAWAVRNVNLDIAPGEIVGLIGGNGSGKTTLIRLMAGLCRPTEGRVTLDGVPLETCREDELRRRFAIMFQDFARYKLSLRDNIAAPASCSDAEISHALAGSGVERMWPKLPQGFDTVLSASFEGGVELSGGEWQRVALARAFVRRDADVLILDEPTSALDIRAERQVIEHLATRRDTQAVVMITHRPAALTVAEKVVLLEKGRASLVRA